MTSALPLHVTRTGTRSLADGHVTHTGVPVSLFSTARATRYLAPLTVVEVVVVQAEHRCEVGHERVSLPAPVVEPSPERSHHVTPEDARQPTHKRRLPAPGVGGYANDHDLFADSKPERVEQGSRQHSGEEDQVMRPEGAV